MPTSGNVGKATKGGGGIISFSVDMENLTKGFDRAVEKYKGTRLRTAIRNGLQEYQDLLVTEIIAEAPTHLKRKIESGQVSMEGNNQFRLRIKIDDPSARAIEFGSGLHATRGKQGTYKIKPGKTSPNLRFYWKRQGRWFIGRNGQAVNHPGVKARPYIAPALRRTRRKLNQILIRNIRSG